MNNKLILDIDASFDNMAAAIIAAEGNKLECIMTVFSCFETVEKGTLRALQANAIDGKNIPVYQGCAQPMSKKLSFGRDQHVILHRQEAIQTSYSLRCAPVQIGKAEKEHAVTKYMELLSNKGSKYDVMLLGPATNLACALRIDSKIANQIGTLYIRAGGINKADVTAYSEKNAWSDPEALQIVSHCGCKIKMLPLDTCLESTIGTCLMDKLEKKLLAETDPSQKDKCVFEGLHNAAHDPYTIGIPLNGCLMLACVDDPEMILETSKEYMDVCLDFNYGEGKTLIADSNLIDTYNLELIRKVDKDKFATYIQNNLLK